MKKIICAALCAAMLLVLVSCGGSSGAKYVFLDETLGV